MERGQRSPLLSAGKGERLSVTVDPNSLHEGHNLAGDIWIEVDDFCFPSIHWGDFPEIILSWWLDALLTLWTGERLHAECLFMDGPYSYEVVRAEGKHILRCYYDPRARREVKREAEIDLVQLLQQVLNAAFIISEASRKRGWRTPDTERLESRFRYIDRAMNSKSG